MGTYFISKIIEAKNIPDALRLEKKGKAEIVEIFKDKEKENNLSKEKISPIGF